MNQNKKALFVATIASHIKCFHEPYLKLLHDNGYKCFVATKNNLLDGESINYYDEFCDISIERSPLRFDNLKAIKQLREIINQEKFDLIHCHTPMGAVVARIAAKRARKKYGTRVIYTAHGFHFFKGAPKKNWLMFYPVEWFLAKYTDTLITINKEDYELAKKKFSKRCHNIEYVPGVGIDINKFDIKMNEKEKKEYRKSLGLKENDFVLTCVARLDNNKNQGFLIDVVNKLVEENYNIHLLLAGRDENNGYYQSLVEKKQLVKNVHFLGNRDDVPELLSITDIVVSASKREGLPVNVMEAFAAGKPVIALNCRGMKDLITDDSFGYIIENEDKEEFCKKVLKIYKNGFDSSTFKDKVQSFSIDNIVNMFKKIYTKEKE